VTPNNENIIRRWDSGGFYHFTDGVCGFLCDGELTVHGGQYRIRLPSRGVLELDEIRQIEELTRQKLLALGGPVVGAAPPAPYKLIVPFETGFATTDEIAEDLLWNSQRINYCCRWVTSGSNGGPDPGFRNISETVIAGIQEGQLGPEDLTHFISSSSALGAPVKEAFFLHNVTSVFEDMRGALLRSEYHFLEMTRLLWQINETQSPAAFQDAMTRPREPQMEIKHASEVADRVADNFTSAVVACHSALDLTLRLCAFLCREPVIDPSFPKGLHFSDVDSGKVWGRLRQHKPGDCSASETPNAIAHLPAGRFSRLSKLRNSLVHNMAADDIRPEIYVGVGLPRIGGQALQYAEYRTRDVRPDGSLVRHEWCERFYEQDTDAQAEMAVWLRNTWDVVYDTSIWLERRLKRDYAERTGGCIP